MGKTCVITGASQGIGRATAIRMSREPDVTGLALIARSAAGLDGTISAMGATGCRIEAFPYDLGNLEGIPTLVDRIVEHFGGIDLLCNIAGYAEPRALLDTSNENLLRTYTVNVFAVMVLTREVVRTIHDRPAKIVNIASTAGITSRPGWLAYASSKAAVVSLSTTMADELAGTGIKVYTISPGRTATELRRTLAPEEDMSSIMQPDQVADVIASLLSDSENVLDGQNIIVRKQV
jgi:3-oxoacyl-[acyl-carrier protein] reductase